MKIEYGKGISLDFEKDNAVPDRVLGGSDDLYWSKPYQSIIHQSPLARFLPKVDLVPETGEPSEAHFSQIVGGLEQCGPSKPLGKRGVSRKELFLFQKGLEDFASAANAPGVQPSSKKFIEELSLANPSAMPEVWRSTRDGKLIILWGYRRNGLQGADSVIRPFSLNPDGKVAVSSGGRGLIKIIGREALKSVRMLLLGSILIIGLLLAILYWLMPRPIADFNVPPVSAITPSSLRISDRSDYDGKNNDTLDQISWWYTSKAVWTLISTNARTTQYGLYVDIGPSDDLKKLDLKSTNRLLGIPFIFKSDYKSSVLPHLVKLAPESKTDGGPKAPAGPDKSPGSKLDVGPKTPSGPGAGPESKPNAGPKTPAGPDKSPESKLDVGPKTPSGTGVGPESKPDVGPNALAGPDKSPESKLDVGPKTPSGTGVGPKSNPDVGSKVPVGPGKSPESKPDVGPRERPSTTPAIAKIDFEVVKSSEATVGAFQLVSLKVEPTPSVTFTVTGWTIDGIIQSNTTHEVTLELRSGKHSVICNLYYTDEAGTSHDITVSTSIDIILKTTGTSELEKSNQTSGKGGFLNQTLPEGKLDATEVYRIGKKGSYWVIAFKDQNPIGTGTAFAIEGNKLITNKHVVQGADQVVVLNREFGERSIPVTVRVADSADLALLTTVSENLPFHLALSSATAQVGQKVFAIGYPLTHMEKQTGQIPDPQLTAGMINHGDRQGEFGEECIQTDTILNPGNSGGPLLNEGARVVGVNTFKVKGIDGTNGAIKASVIISSFPELK